jgi:thiamine-phosphate pyrophosphorylase
MTDRRSERTVSWRLMLITDRQRAKRPFLEVIEQACAAGIGAIQLREKDLNDKDLFLLADRVQRITRRFGVPLIVNHNVGVALAVEADGVHLGGRSLPLDAGRRVIGADMLLGASTHTIDEARVSSEMGADYLVFGPVFDTPSKRGLVSTAGIDPITDLKRFVTIPILALGGIKRANLRQVLAAGFDGAACIGEVMEAADPGQAVAEMNSMIKEFAAHSAATAVS